MKVLISGISGFIGSFLARELLRSKKFQVTGLVRSSSDLWRLEDIKNEVELIDVDEPTIGKHDVFVHLATNYGRNQRTSDILLSNFIWPIQVIEKALESNPELRIVNTDTFFSKSNFRYEYLKEYTFSKKSFREFLQYSNVPFVNMQLEHVFGPMDNIDKFVPSILKRILDNEKGIDLTDGEQKRDFIYVEDVVKAYRMVLASDSVFQLTQNIEVGYGHSVSIRDFVESIHGHCASSSTLNWGALPQRSGEFEASQADQNGLSLINWMPTYTLEEGIIQTIDYYKSR